MINILKKILKWLIPLSIFGFITYFLILLSSGLLGLEHPRELAWMVAPSILTAVLMGVVVIEGSIKEIKEKLKELKELEDGHQEEA